MLLDLAGPKIRIESFVEGKVMLLEGKPFMLDTSLDPKAGTIKSVGVAYKNLINDVKGGDTLLLNDGQIVLDVDRVEGTRIHLGDRISPIWISFRSLPGTWWMSKNTARSG